MLPDNNRRTFLKGIGVTGATALGLTTVASTAAADDKTSITVKDEPANQALIEQARKVDYQEVTKVSRDTYKITLLPAQAPADWEANVVDKTPITATPNEIIGGPEEVQLGNDTAFYDMKSGDSGGWWSGSVVGNAGSSIDLTADRAEAAALAVGGYGDISQYAWVGVPFFVQGGGSQTAEITISGMYNGRVVSTPSGSFSLTITAFVENKTTGAVYETEVHHNDSTIFDGYIYNQIPFSATLNPTLRTNETYRAYAKITAKAGVSGVADACCDFGPGDGDNGNPKQGLYVNNVDITF